MPNAKFNTGDKVSWVSGQTSKLKIGPIVAIVPPKQDAKAIADALAASGTQFRFAYGGGGSRALESYLVLVPARGRAKPTLYWPVTSQLEKVGE